MSPFRPAPGENTIRDLATEAGFEIAGVADALPLADHARFRDWVDAGNAATMVYLTDHRAGMRSDVRSLLPSAQSVICVGKLYNGPEPYSTEFSEAERGWISRYAWGDDYHTILRAGLERLAHSLETVTGPFEWRACVDTAPVLERSLARKAGLGWIGKNTCLINQQRGSWFFLGELLTSLPLTPSAEQAPDRCGSCTRCIDACPTQAIVPAPAGRFHIDSRLCISYLTIERRGAIDEPLREAMGSHVFGCDICQDVCPWNRRAAITDDFRFAPHAFAPPLTRLAALTESEFRNLFRYTPVERARYRGFLRNVAIAMGNAGLAEMMEPLRKLCAFDDEVVSSHARWALRKVELKEVAGHASAHACLESSLSS